MAKSVLILLVCCSLALPSCRRDNLRISPNDIPVRISLRRSWARSNTKFRYRHADIDYCIEDVEKIGDLLIISVLVFIQVSVELAVSAAHETRFTVCPENRPDYRQRIYWGRNIVYFPPDTDLKNATLAIHATGDRKGAKLLKVDLSKRKKVRLK